MKPALNRTLGVLVLCLACTAPGLFAPASAGPIDIDGHDAVLKNKATFRISQYYSDPDGGDLVSIREASLGDRGDAFDGAMRVIVNGFTVASRDGQAIRKGPELTTKQVYVGGFDAQLTYRAIPKTSTMRVLLRIGNSNDDPITTSDVEVRTSLGSDSETGLEATSDGNDIYTAADRWLVTYDETFSDPAVSQVYAGRDSRVEPYFATLNTDETITSFHEITIQPGASRYLMFFTRLDRTAEGGLQAMTPFNRGHLLNRLTAGLSEKVRRAVLNWDL